MGNELKKIQKNKVIKKKIVKKIKNPYDKNIEKIPEISEDKKTIEEKKEFINSSGKVLISNTAEISTDLKDKGKKHYIDLCLTKVIEEGASDLHLFTGYKPMIRYLGELKEVEMPVFTEKLAEKLLNEILTKEQREELENKMNVDFMYIKKSSKGPPLRFRTNAYYHRSGLNVVMRIIPNKIPTFRELGLPDIVAAFGRFSRGLVLITGSSGCGKTTTIASMIDLINRERNAHIITIEDPVEFIHSSRRCIVRQRQVGIHTKSYNRALKASMREDPDVIFVSEIRDLETIILAMTAAETGCLVLSTMNTTSATRTIDRIIDSFPPDQRLQAAAMLSESLKAVVSQQLVPSIDQKRRYAIVEILIGCTPLMSLIREEKTFQIQSLIMTSRGIGMQSMDTSLLELYEKRLISLETAKEAAIDKTIFNKIK